MEVAGVFHGTVLCSGEAAQSTLATVIQVFLTNSLKYFFHLLKEPSSVFKAKLFILAFKALFSLAVVNIWGGREVPSMHFRLFSALSYMAEAPCLGTTFSGQHCL